MTETPKQQLLELRYVGDLSADIAAWLQTGQSWRDIRHHVERKTGLRVSHESLRTWYGPNAEHDE